MRNFYMRIKGLLVFCAALLTFNGSVFAQSMWSGIAPPGSLYSLQGFDMSLDTQKALGEGFSGTNYTNAIKYYQRQFIILKYKLYSDPDDPMHIATTVFPSPGKYNPGMVANAPCTNEDFETGTLSGWTDSLGTNLSSTVYPTTTTQVSTAP